MVNIYDSFLYVEFLYPEIEKKNSYIENTFVQRNAIPVAMHLRRQRQLVYVLILCSW